MRPRLTLLLFGLVACSNGTSLLVRISSDLDVPLVELRVDVRNDSETWIRDYSFDPLASPLPISLTLEQEPQIGARVWVRADAVGAGNQIRVRRRVHVSFIPGERRVLELALNWSCLDVNCPGALSCDRGICLDGEQDLQPQDGGVAHGDAGRPPWDAGLPPDLCNPPCNRGSSDCISPSHHAYCASGDGDCTCGVRCAPFIEQPGCPSREIGCLWIEREAATAVTAAGACLARGAGGQQGQPCGVVLENGVVVADSCEPTLNGSCVGGSASHTGICSHLCLPRDDAYCARFGLACVFREGRDVCAEPPPPALEDFNRYCSLDSDCSGGLCVNLGMGGFCSAPCTGLRTCPSNAACVWGNGIPFCAQTCTSHGQCWFDGSMAHMCAERDGARVCL